LAQFIIDFPGVFFYQDRYEWLFPLLVASCSDKMSILVMTLFSGIIFAVNMWYAIQMAQLVIQWICAML
jgi:hypothetical protein